MGAETTLLSVLQEGKHSPLHQPQLKVRPEQPALAAFEEQFKSVLATVEVMSNVNLHFSCQKEWVGLYYKDIHISWSFVTYLEKRT